MPDPNPPKLPPPSHSSPPSGTGAALAWIVAWLGWALVAFVGLVFITTLLFWLLVMVAFSVIAGWITGRPSTVTTLWRQYRQMAAGRWPHPPSRKASSTPRADSVPAAAGDEGVQDVKWREVPGEGERGSR